MHDRERALRIDGFANAGKLGEAHGMIDGVLRPRAAATKRDDGDADGNAEAVELDLHLRDGHARVRNAEPSAPALPELRVADAYVDSAPEHVVAGDRREQDRIVVHEE